MAHKVDEKNKKRILYLLIAITSIPFFFAVNMPASWGLDSANLKTIAQYISAVAGYIGVSLILWELILGTRSVTGLFFDDVPKTLKIHSWLGKYGTLLIFLHPLLITYSYGEGLFYSFIPNLSTDFNQAVTYGRLAFFILLAVWVTSALLRGNIKYRPWKYIHYLVYFMLPLIFLHVPDVGSSFANTFIQFYWYLFIIIFLIFISLRMRHLFGYGKVYYQITSHQQILSDTYLLKLVPQEKTIDIKLGQYIYIQRSLFAEEHPFTVLDAHKESGEILVAYKVFGSYTQKLSVMQIGESLLIDGPYGTFTSQLHHKPKKSAVFISGGIGITPFTAYILDKKPEDNYMLFFANKNIKTAPFRSMLKEILGPNYIDIFSRDNSPASLNNERGYISSEILTKYIQNPLEYDFFICGNPGLMETTEESLLSLGIPATKIHTEKFNF